MFNEEIRRLSSEWPILRPSERESSSFVATSYGRSLYALMIDMTRDDMIWQVYDMMRYGKKLPTYNKTIWLHINDLPLFDLISKCYARMPEVICQTPRYEQSKQEKRSELGARDMMLFTFQQVSTQYSFRRVNRVSLEPSIAHWILGSMYYLHDRNEERRI